MPSLALVFRSETRLPRIGTIDWTVSLMPAAGQVKVASRAPMVPLESPVPCRSTSEMFRSAVICWASLTWLPAVWMEMLV
ncbi:hypothetical protein A5710_11250 [Mycolicibacter sinensis]|uniref:Uncharacterized protein n=1 Tax=Mycolicibacter sinensis (strain JDM601) TaxID=875328 RepID=A0A1A2NMX1_MYCSD|nr:hypothetical protein A5694_06420 [Mycolicibacter sinensis]OBI24264.1 hypothetical protein A5710_11250 [Mycolicibacter sinensis]